MSAIVTETFGPLADYARLQPCLVPMCFSRTEPHHVKTRGAGGTDVEGFDGGPNVVPLCRLHHVEGHRIGWRTFERRYDLDLKLEAAKLYRRFVG